MAITVYGDQAFESSTGSYTVYADISLDPKCWLDASDTSTIITSGSTVTDWSSKAPNNNGYVFQRLESGQAGPTVTTKTVNGVARDTIDYTGAQSLQYDTDTIINVNGIWTIIVCSESDLTTANQYVMTFTDKSSTSDYLLIGTYAGAVTDDPIRTAWNDDGGVTPILFDINNYSAATTYIAVAQQASNSGTRNAWLNNTAGVSVGAGDADDLKNIAGVDVVTLSGAWWPNDIFGELNGRIHEVMIFERFLSNGEREYLQTYLAHKWGATLS